MRLFFLILWCAYLTLMVHFFNNGHMGEWGFIGAVSGAYLIGGVENTLRD